MNTKDNEDIDYSYGFHQALKEQWLPLPPLSSGFKPGSYYLPILDGRAELSIHQCFIKGGWPEKAIPIWGVGQISFNLNPREERLLYFYDKYRFLMPRVIEIQLDFSIDNIAGAKEKMMDRALSFIPLHNLASILMTGHLSTLDHSQYFADCKNCRRNSPAESCGCFSAGNYPKPLIE